MSAAAADPAPSRPRGRRAPSELGTNSVATACFVLGLLGWFPVVLGWFPIIALLAVGCGVVAFRQMRERSQTGRVRTVVGLGLAAIWILYWANNAWADATAVKDEGRLSAPVMPVGQCFDYEPTPQPTAPGTSEQSETIEFVQARPCDGPHDGQVVAVVRFTGSYPGESEVITLASSECDRLVPQAVPTDRLAGVDQSFIYPGKLLWQAQMRATCLVSSPDGKLTGSVLD